LYVSPVELRDAVGAVELSQLATPAGRLALDAAKLNAIIAGTLAGSDPDFADATLALATINEALERRQGYVNGYLAAYSPLPIADADVPDLLKQIVIALVRYDLANAPTAAVTRRYTDALADLKAIGEGTIKLPLASNSATTETGFGPDTYGLDPIYSRGATQRFQSPSGRFP
jgi:phage gp36-like protein